MESRTFEARIEADVPACGKTGLRASAQRRACATRGRAAAFDALSLFFNTTLLLTTFTVLELSTSLTLGFEI